MVAAAYVHTIRKWGPDRVAGFSPIPAMSMVSHASGARFTSLIGGSMLSLLRLVRRPAGRLAAGVRRPDRRARVRRLVGRRLPGHVGLQRAGHPHPGRALDDRGPLPRPEGRRGLARLRRQREVRRRVAGHPARHRRRAGDGDGPRDPQGVLRRPGDAVLRRLHEEYTDLPYLVALEPGAGRHVPGRQVPHRRRPAGARRRGERRTSRPCWSTGAPATWWCPTARSATGSATPGVGQVEPRPRRRRPAADPARARADETVSVELPRFDDVDGTPGSLPREVPGPAGRRPAGDHGLRPDAGAVRRRPGRAGRRLRHVVRRRERALHAGLAGADHRRAGVRGRPDRARVRAERRGVQGPLDDPDGRRHQPLVPLRHDLPRLPRADHAHRLPGRQRRRLGALRRPGEVPPGHRLGAARLRPGLEAAAAADDPHGLLVPAHRPVPLRHVRRGHGLGQDRAAGCSPG